MSRQGKDPSIITEHAYRFAQRHKKKGYQVMSPGEVFAKIDEIRGDRPETPWSMSRVCVKLNENKIVRGHWNGQGSILFSPNTIVSMYRSYSKTTFGGVQYKKTAQTTLPGLTDKVQAKPGPRAQSTPQAKAFVRRYPTFTIMSKTAFKKFVLASIAEDKSGVEIAKALNDQKLLRPSYTGGSSKWSGDTVSDLFKRLNHSQTLSDVRFRTHGTKRAKTATPKPGEKTKKKQAAQPKMSCNEKKIKTVIEILRGHTPSKKTFTPLPAEADVEGVSFVPGKNGVVRFVYSCKGSLKDPEVMELFRKHHGKLQTS